MTESTGMGARARIFLIAFAAFSIVAISHPSLGAAATNLSDPAPGATPLVEGDASSSSATAPEEPSSNAPVVSNDPVEAPIAEPMEAPAAEPAVVTPVAEPPPVAPSPPAAEAPPLDIPITEPPPLVTPTAEPVDTGEVGPPVTEGLAGPAVGAPVAMITTTPEAAVPQAPELAPAAAPGESIVIQTASERESGRPITAELRAVLIADSTTTLTRLADVSSVGTTTRPAAGRSVRGSVERPSPEVHWPPQTPPPSEAPVPSRVGFTSNGGAPTGGGFRPDLALALSAVALAFSLIIRVARPMNSRLYETALVARIPQPG